MDSRAIGFSFILFFWFVWPLFKVVFDLSFLQDLNNRVLQQMARIMPGARTWRIRFHRWRGVTIGSDVFIGTDVILETSYPHLIEIGDDVSIGIRTTIVGHFRSSHEEAQKIKDPKHRTVYIGNHVFIGPHVMVLPNVTIGDGAVVAAGSVVNRSVEPMTMVRGNPATVIAICGVPLGAKTPKEDFFRSLKRLNTGANQPSGQE